MSNWTYISGVIEVSPWGRTQAEKTYILETVLAHLPKVTGSEVDMVTYFIQETGVNESRLYDEFYQFSNLTSQHGRFYVQSDYLVVVRGKFRDRVLDETKREFLRWMCRFAKRLPIMEIAVDIRNDCDEHFAINDYIPWLDMFECNNSWCEFMMWEESESGLPKKLENYYEINNEEYRT